MLSVFVMPTRCDILEIIWFIQKKKRKEVMLLVTPFPYVISADGEITMFLLSNQLIDLFSSYKRMQKWEFVDWWLSRGSLLLALAILLYMVFLILYYSNHQYLTKMALGGIFLQGPKSRILWYQFVGDEVINFCGLVYFQSFSFGIGTDP